MGEKEEKAFNIGMIGGFCLCTLIFLLFFSTQLLPNYSIVQKDFQSEPDDVVRIISSQWDDCYLSIGVYDDRLYWKCDRFASPIREYKCYEDLNEA